MKKVIYLLGMLFLILIILLNVIVTSTLDRSEHITMKVNTVWYIVGLILASATMYSVCYGIQKRFSSANYVFMKKYVKIGCIICYSILCIGWVILVNPRVVGDSAHVAAIAQLINRGDTATEILQGQTYANIPISEYMQAYPQQVNLGFVFSLFFKILHFDTVMELLRVFNVISNIAIVIAIFLLQKQLSKQYATNSTLSCFCILTFFSIILLSTFVYGDIPSLALCLFSVYTIMRYQETKKISYAFVAMFLISFACMLRMNSFIFVIAIAIYLGLAIWKERKEKTKKEKMLAVGILLVYSVVAILPSLLVPTFFLNKYHLKTGETYPVESYLLMAMEPSPRANGWYHEEIASYALKNIETAPKEYQEKIKERIFYFIQNPDDACWFYLSKIASMWTENTYSAVQNNIVKDDYSLEAITNPLTFYQKAMLLLICVSSVLGLIRYRKNLSLEVILLLTIFVGGFTFHLLWEAKSRYIIPYIVVLIPLASLYMPKREKIKNENIQQKESSSI